MSPTKAPQPESTLQETDPLLPLEHLFQWLAGAAAHLMLGLLFGLLAARAMRHVHLHWSWAGGALAATLLVPLAPTGLTTTAAVAALAATVCGRRWHLEDLQAGADLAALAAERATPLQALGGGARRARSRLGASRLVPPPGARWLRGLGLIERDPREPGVGQPAIGGHRLVGLHRLTGLLGRPRPGADDMVLGVTHRGRPVSIELGGIGGGAGGGTHTLVAGATGSGKTVTLTWILTRAIACGMAAVVVDPKHDRWLREQLRRAAHAAGRRFLVWTPEGPSVYNPYGRGGETEVADKALAGERFTEPHYLRQAQRYLGHAVRALRATGVPVSLASLVRALDPGELEVLARELPPGHARTVHAYLDSLTPRQRTDLTGVRDRLAIMAESDVGRWLSPDGDGQPLDLPGEGDAAGANVRAAGDGQPLDLLAAVQDGWVVYFDLRADSRPLLARMLAGAIVQDLQTVVAALQDHPVRCVVAIDEFSAVAAEHVAALFGRARSAGVSLLLGTQELTDLCVPGRETLREQVLGNLTTLIAHRQVVPESAELIARLAGTVGAWRTTVASDGRCTRTRIAVSLVDPEQAMRLPRGCAAVLRLAGPHRAVLARVHSPERGR